MANVKSSIAHLATDPLRNFKFRVSITHPTLKAFATMGYMSVSGLNITTDPVWTNPPAPGPFIFSAALYPSGSNCTGRR